MKSTKLKIAVLIALAFGLVFMLSGCSSSADESAPAPTVTVTEVPSEDVFGETYTAEDEFLFDVRSIGNVYIENISDADLLELGYLVCGAFDEGYTVDDLAYELAATGDYSGSAEQEYAGTIIAGSVLNLCPEYSYQIN